MFFNRRRLLNVTARFTIKIVLVILSLLLAALVDPLMAAQSFSSSTNMNAISIDIPKKDFDVCGDIWENYTPDAAKVKKVKIGKQVLKNIPERFSNTLSPALKGLSFSPKKLFLHQCNSYKKELVDAISEPFVNTQKQITAAHTQLKNAPKDIMAHSLAELRRGFYIWLAWEIQDQILPKLSPEERKKFLITEENSVYAQQKAHEWLGDGKVEIDALVKAYLKEHHKALSKVYESYLDLTGGQSQEIIKGFSALLTEADGKLKRFGVMKKELVKPSKQKTPYAKILKKNGFSKEWVDDFRGYEGRLRSLDKQFNIKQSTDLIIKSFQTDDPSGKIAIMFDLLDTIGGTAADSHLPIVSLFGDIIQSYAQVAKEMLEAVNGLGEALRKRSGYCVGTGTPIGNGSTNRHKEAKQALAQFPGELLCPMSFNRSPWLHIYEAQELPSGRLFFWDGKKFITGQKDGGGKPAVQESLKLLSAARRLKYQTVDKEEKQVALLASIYNTPFPGGIPALMKESREVLGGIADLVRKLEPTIGRNEKNCEKQDLWDYLMTETGLDVNAFQKEFYEQGLERLTTTYVASYVAKNGGFGKKNKGRGNAYKKYKRIWDKAEGFNVRKVTGQVRNENNPDVSCQECTDAGIEVKIRNGLQIPGCETTQADERSHYNLYVITTKPTFNIDITTTVNNISSDRLPLTEENFLKWDLIEQHLYVKLKKKETKEQTRTKKEGKQEEKTEPEEPGLKTLPEPDPDAEPPEVEGNEPVGEPETEASETEQDKKADNTDSTSPPVKVGETVTLPDVVGMGLMDAVAAIEAVGLFALPEVGRSALTPDNVGKVEVAFPAQDGEVHAGDQIVLRVFDEAVDSGNVPNTIGMELAEASDVIKLAGFSPVFELGDETSDPKQDGTVASQAPAPGIEIEAGKDVTLIIYSLAVETRTVPNLKGMGLKAAQQKLKSNDLFLTPFLEEAASKKSDEGRVYKQYPEPGLDVMNGIAISVWVYGEVDEPVVKEKVEKSKQAYPTGGVETIYGTFNPDGTYESNGIPEVEDDLSDLDPCSGLLGTLPSNCY